jgi:endonuclease YncB( thermonuclease family)
MPSASPRSAPATYAALRRDVEATLLTGRLRIDQAWVRTYWETGRLINEHVLLNQDRAHYGAQVFSRLAEDLKVSKRQLYECAQFARCFPIVRDRAQLTWAHYRLLCQVPDPARRKALLAETVKLRLNSPQLEQRVRALAPPEPAALDITAVTVAADSAAAPPKLLTPKRGVPGICKIVASGELLAADLGFATNLDLPADTLLKAGDCVQINAPDFPSLNSKLSTLNPSYTYAATVLKVVDGDTLWVRVYLRPGLWVKQKLRLRDLDCPELPTPEGKAAKRFTESLVARAAAVTVCTTKPDKYDRYLADVFLATDAGEVFLNNALLENGHATVKRAWEFSDWGG